MSRNTVQVIRIGDVLVGLPDEKSAGLPTFDFGKENKDRLHSLRLANALATTKPIIRSAISIIRIKQPLYTARLLSLPRKIAIESMYLAKFPFVTLAYYSLFMMMV